MKTSILVFHALFICIFPVLSQKVLDSPSDTLKFTHRTGGVLDTFDLSYSFPINSSPNGGFHSLNNAPNINFFQKSPNLLSIYSSPVIEKWTISALPHIGFQYSAGTKGLQFVHMDYQQHFRNGLLLNLALNKSSSAGLTQNNNFQNQTGEIGLKYTKSKFGLEIKGSYQSAIINHSGGIRDSLAWQIDTLGLEFAPVNKTNCNSAHKLLNTEAFLRYSLLKDSSERAFGIQTFHQFNIWNRVYNEISDSLGLIYPTVNLSQDSTRDQFQEAKLKNGIGLFYSDNRISVDAGVSHRYWRFQNLGTNRDTNEIGTEINLKYRWNRISFQSHSDFNIIGAKQEFRTQNTAKYSLKKARFWLKLNHYSVLPELFQRNYFANNLNYSNPLNKQKTSEAIVGSSMVLKKMEFKLEMGAIRWDNKLVWENDNWVVNSFSNQSFQFISANLHLDMGLFQLYPSATMQKGSEFIPETTVSGRFLIKKKVFKAKKLELLWAVDPIVRSQYKLMEYSTLLENYSFSSASPQGGQTFLLHSTFSMGIDEFRLFLRAENIQSFWGRDSIQEVRKYYRAPFLFRVGFSWDFFN